MNPFDQLRRELNAPSVTDDSVEVRADVERADRTGAPEVVLAAGKSTEQIVTSVRALLEHSGRVIVSRLSTRALAELTDALGDQLELAPTVGARAALVTRPGSQRRNTYGRVAVISAGTSDIAVASEAVLMTEEMGCEVRTAWDVGIAGLHRLVRPLEAMVEWDPDVIVVAAGMDGVLPAVIAGLVPQPVIGLPVSTGYGAGGEGMGALTTMLQSCAPGIAVVNIDNGIGAGAMAALIANRAARFRAAPPPTTP